MTKEQMRDWIDRASYQQLLQKWRMAPSGDPFFQGDIGTYYQEKMAEKRKEVGGAAHVRASKNIGSENENY